MNNTKQNIKPGYKKTPVGMIPEDWEVRKIKDLTSRIGDGIHSTPNYTENGEYFFVNGNNLRNGSIVIDENTKTVTEEESLKHKRNLNERTILMSINGTIGNLAFYKDEEVILGKSACYLNINKNVDINYFYFQIGSYKTHKSFLKRLTGSTIKNLGLNEIRKTKLPIPPLPEQKSIANCLSTWDQGIKKLTQLIQAKKQQKKGLMQQLFNGQLTVDNGQLSIDNEQLTINNGQLKMNNASPEQGRRGQLKRVENEEERLKGWKEVRLGEVANCLDNVRVPLNSKERGEMKGNIPYCGANGVVDYVNDFVIDDDIILMAEDGGYFNEFQTRPIAYRMKGKCWVNNHAHILKAKENFNHIFLFYSLIHKNVVPYISGGTRAKLNKKDLLQIKIKTPNQTKEQTAIAEVLQTADQEIALLEQKLAGFRQQKKGLMQVLLTGEKRLMNNEQ